ncbi:MAG TPA: DUF2865 domain-containing protein [Rhizobiaceae bacterium]|nr:DUF2865 domain-containing protein [Rhizobiaceae bacterium]
MAVGRKGLAGAALLLTALALGLTDAAAASRLCRQLEAQLASGGGGGGNSAQFKKYDRAVAKQRDQLSKARSTARRSGCRFTLFGSDERCGSINAQIEKMEANLDSLERKRTELSGGGGMSRRERAKIMASIEANGCRDSEERTAERKLPPPVTVRSRDGGSLFDQLFGGGIRRDGSSDTTIEPYENDGTGHYGPSGSFRTVCVRTCDGYFFPMSGGSSGRDFTRDQANCESMCPGTDVQLYYDYAGSEGSEQMMSVASGEPYSALPTAYQYKDLSTPSPQGCGCNPAKNYATFGDTTEEAEDAEPATPVPAIRPDPGASPEALANAEGKLDAAAIARILKPKPAATAPEPPADPADRKIRVVGPVFLPDQEGAIDLRAPGQKKVQ